jgi:hypothetical protein
MDGRLEDLDGALVSSGIGLETKSIVRATSGLCGTHNDKDTKEQEKQNDEQTGMA